MLSLRSCPAPDTRPRPRGRAIPDPQPNVRRWCTLLHHRRPGLAAALVALALLAGGCGGSSSPFSGSFHAPAGYVAYHGGGYVVAMPKGFVAKPGSVPDQPPGSSVTELTPGGASVVNTNREILLLENPHLQFTLDQVVSNLRQADRTNPEVSHPDLSATTATVPGARAARIVTENYVAPISPSNPTPTAFHRKWLMVLIKPRVLLDVVVVDAPKTGAVIDADAVIHSFRLHQ
jgi:hypothetical protein